MAPLPLARAFSFRGQGKGPEDEAGWPEAARDEAGPEQYPSDETSTTAKPSLYHSAHRLSFVRLVPLVSSW